MTTPRPHAELAARQSVTDALRLAAKSAAPHGTAMIGASHLIDAADTIDNLRTQLAEAQRDAARYRTLRSLWFQFGTMANIRTEPGISLHRINMAGDLHTLDVAIDAAKGARNA